MFGLPEAATQKDDSVGRLRNRLIVGMAARAIAEALGMRCVIVTARIRAGMKGNLLHPIATWPTQLNPFFLDPKTYEGFSFDVSALSDDSGTSLGWGDDVWKARSYDISSLDDKGKGARCFAGRIQSFFSSLEGRSETYGIDREDLANLRRNGKCLVFGGIRHDSDGLFVPPRRRVDEFYYFLALYVVPVSTDAHVSARGSVEPAVLRDISGVLPEMFGALEISIRGDKEEFERDGLDLLTELIPALSSPNAAPSDAIAYFLRRMGEILKRHTLGIEDQHTWVRFIVIDAVTKDGTLTPKFQVFPYHEAAGSLERALGAFVVSHPKRVSTVKLILWLWARRFNVNLSKEFEGLFTNMNMVDERVFDSGSKSACFSSDDDGDLWKRVNVDVTDEGTTQCTLGFVVERSVSNRKFPYAIIAFESDIPDAFSRQDVDRFRNVVDACSSLLLGLHLASAGFDMKQSIRDAFADTSRLTDIANQGQDPIPFGRFRFELLRVDRDLLLHIVESKRDRIWDGDGLGRDDAQKYVTAVLKGMPGGRDEELEQPEGDRSETARIVYDKILRERSKWIVENEATLHDAWAKSGVASDIYEFLANIPSNIVWHCYLNAVARVIAWRASREDFEPRFTVMQHGGHSALAMFVLSTGPHEFRQIVKLSDRYRISIEEKLYRTYVRYNVPLSARLEESGKAYESDGDIRDAAQVIPIPISKRSFGALVSDLIAGSRDEKEPTTLLTRILELIKAQNRRTTTLTWRPFDDEVTEFRAAIKYQFETNTSRWRPWEGGRGWVPHGRSVDGTVREITRYHVRDERETAFARVWDRLGDPKSQYDKLMRSFAERVVGLQFNEIAATLREFERYGTHLAAIDSTELASIIHGDLNARNLVWSKDYVKFFMIDFERVGMGFYGADQLRLVFSVVGDLSRDAYQEEQLGAGASAESVGRVSAEIGEVALDAVQGIECVRMIMSDIKGSSAGGDAIRLPEEPRGSVTATAVREILNTVRFKTVHAEFWAFAIAMAGTKQLEYALRELDESASETLARLVKAERLGEGNVYNFHAYFQPAELMAHQHDKVVLGKIARVLFSYAALAAIK